MRGTLNCLPWSFDQFKRNWPLLLVVMVETHVSGAIKCVTLTNLRYNIKDTYKNIHCSDHPAIFKWECPFSSHYFL